MAKLFYLSPVTPWLMQEGKLDPILQQPTLAAPTSALLVNPIAPDPDRPQGVPGAAEPTWSSCEQPTTLRLAAQTEAIFGFCPHGWQNPKSQPPGCPAPAGSERAKPQHSYRGERTGKRVCTLGEENPERILTAAAFLLRGGKTP